MGYAKAFGYGNLNQFSKEISKPMGLLWLATALIFFTGSILILTKKEFWPILAIIGVVLSQILIFTVWEDTKFGTIANIIVLVVSIVGLAHFQFENSYQKEVLRSMEKTKTTETEITEKDLEHLPPVVQEYLHYVGVIGKPKIKNMRIEFEGEMRDRKNDWFKFTSEQYSFFEDPTRLFFMKARVNGLPTSGYHAYKNDEATMLIKVLSLLPVVNIENSELFPTETVTFFNDLCLFAPAALIDNRITWEPLNGHSVRAMFTNKGTTISAILRFNEKGRLTDFSSNDRIAIDEMKTHPFSTPVSNFKNTNGYNLPTYGEAVWHYPKGEFVYGKFNLKSVEYNVKPNKFIPSR